MDLDAFDDFALAMSKTAVAAKEAADAMSKLAAAAVDWPMTIAQLSTLLVRPEHNVFPPLGVKLT